MAAILFRHLREAIADLFLPHYLLPKRAGFERRPKTFNLPLVGDGKL
jgi:hypothetical protein